MNGSDITTGGTIIMTVIAGADWIYQRQKWFEKQKMSLRDIKDEHKAAEGDPAVKGKLRQLRMTLGLRNSAVNRALVIQDGKPACRLHGERTVRYSRRDHPPTRHSRGGGNAPRRGQSRSRKGRVGGFPPARD